jgi:hypothetical protein
MYAPGTFILATELVIIGLAFAEYEGTDALSDWLLLWQARFLSHLLFTPFFPDHLDPFLIIALQILIGASQSNLLVTALFSLLICLTLMKQSPCTIRVLTCSAIAAALIYTSSLWRSAFIISVDSFGIFRIICLIFGILSVPNGGSRSGEVRHFGHFLFNAVFQWFRGSQIGFYAAVVADFALQYAGIALKDTAFDKPQ